MGRAKEIAANFVVAHSAEARSVIDYYRLVKSAQHTAFNVFERDNCRLIVSGQGKVNSACATTYLAAQCTHDASHTIWLNFGVAGHLSHPLGSLWRVNKIHSETGNRHYYPPNVCRKYMPRGNGLMTTSHIRENYSNHLLHDMEAIGYYQAAVKFAPAELIQSLKVVSDNQQNSHQNIDYKTLPDKLMAVMDQIDDYLVELNSILINNLYKIKQPIEIKHIKLSRTQKIQVDNLLESLNYFDVDIRKEIAQCSNSDQLMEALEHAIDQIELVV